MKLGSNSWEVAVCSLLVQPALPPARDPGQNPKEEFAPCWSGTRCQAKEGCQGTNCWFAHRDAWVESKTVASLILFCLTSLYIFIAPEVREWACISLLGLRDQGSWGSLGKNSEGLPACSAVRRCAVTNRESNHLSVVQTLYRLSPAIRTLIWQVACN